MAIIGILVSICLDLYLSACLSRSRSLPLSLCTRGCACACLPRDTLPTSVAIQARFSIGSRSPPSTRTMRPRPASRPWYCINVCNVLMHTMCVCARAQPAGRGIYAACMRTSSIHTHTNCMVLVWCLVLVLRVCAHARYTRVHALYALYILNSLCVCMCVHVCVRV